MNDPQVETTSFINKETNKSNGDVIMGFEKELTLVRNAKVGSGFVARVNLEKKEIEFQDRVEGSKYYGTYIFKNGEFYIIRYDESSWRNRFQTYVLYYAKDFNLHEIARIEIEKDKRTFIAEDDELKTLLKQFFIEKRRYVDALVELAVVYAERNNIKINVSDIVKIKEELRRIMNEHSLKRSDLLQIVLSL